MDRRNFLRSIATIPAVGLINFKIPQEPVGLDVRKIERLCGGFGDGELILILDKTCTPLKNNKYKLWETTHDRHYEVHGKDSNPYMKGVRFTRFIESLIRHLPRRVNILKLDKSIGYGVHYKADKIIEIDAIKCVITKNRQAKRGDFSRLDIL